MFKFAIPVLHVTSSAAAEEFYCDRRYVSFLIQSNAAKGKVVSSSLRPNRFEPSFVMRKELGTARILRAIANSQTG